MTTWRRILQIGLGSGCVVAAALTGPTITRAADADLAKLIEAAKQEGEVHYIDALNQPKTQALLESRRTRRGHDGPPPVRRADPEGGAGGDTYERVLDETRALIGDPDDVARQLTYIRETFGDVYPTFQINFGMMEKATARRSMELFVRHVMPRFR